MTPDTSGSDAYGSVLDKAQVNDAIIQQYADMIQLGIVLRLTCLFASAGPADRRHYSGNRESSAYLQPFHLILNSPAQLRM